ncbi:MAG: hypothetical protein ACPGNV_18375, partial [Mangrovicoccus sp.]
MTVTSSASASDISENLSDWQTTPADNGGGADLELEPDAAELEAIAAILAGEDTAEDTAPDAAAEDAGPDGGAEAENPGAEAQPEKTAGEAPKTLTEAAERLQMDPEALYALTVTTGDGEELTIGQLKDQAAERGVWMRENAEREQQLTERESANRKEGALWAAIGRDMVQNLGPERIEQLRGHLAQRDQVERQKLFDVMPELKDPAALQAFQGETVALFEEYGLSGDEVAISDHRLILMLRDFQQLRGRMAKLANLAQQKKTKQPPKPPRGKAGPAPRKAKSARGAEL